MFSKAFQTVLIKHTNANQILKEREMMLSGKGYGHLEVNLDNKQFLQPVGSENTEASVCNMSQKFIEYTRKTFRPS